MVVAATEAELSASPAELGDAGAVRITRERVDAEFLVRSAQIAGVEPDTTSAGRRLAGERLTDRRRERVDLVGRSHGVARVPRVVAGGAGDVVGAIVERGVIKRRGRARLDRAAVDGAVDRRDTATTSIVSRRGDAERLPLPAQDRCVEPPARSHRVIRRERDRGRVRFGGDGVGDRHQAVARPDSGLERHAARGSEATAAASARARMRTIGDDPATGAAVVAAAAAAPAAVKGRVIAIFARTACAELAAAACSGLVATAAALAVRKRAVARQPSQAAAAAAIRNMENIGVVITSTVGCAAAAARHEHPVGETAAADPQVRGATTPAARAVCDAAAGRAAAGRAAVEATRTPGVTALLTTSCSSSWATDNDRHRVTRRERKGGAGMAAKPAVLSARTREAPRGAVHINGRLGDARRHRPGLHVPRVGEDARCLADSRAIGSARSSCRRRADDHRDNNPHNRN